MKKNNKLKIIIISSLSIFVLYFVINSVIIGGKFDNLKSIFSNKQKYLITKYFFPYKFISQQEKKNTKLQKKIDYLTPYILNFELKFKKYGEDIKVISNDKKIKLEGGYYLKKYKLLDGFYVGINNLFPGSGFIDFNNNDIFILSATGVLAYKNKINDQKENFKQIENNIENFISYEQFSKKNWFSLKDLLIFKNKIFISFTEEIKKDCWNTSVIYGDINYANIVFKKLFSDEKCIHSKENPDKEFNALQSGGRLVGFDNYNILFSTGEYRSRYLAQNDKSINGKIIKINFYNYNYKILSKGHRNPQGLVYDNKNDFILETEHGPRGGDEINLIEIKETKEKNIPNYGWPISSYGEHYKNIKNKYDKYPLYKSHKKYGFIEPLKTFVPSIGISEIVKLKNNFFVVSSLKDKSIYFFKLNKEKKIIDINRVEIFERIRDLKFNNNKLYLFLEDTSSIGVIDIN